MKSVVLLVFLPAALLLCQPETATLRGVVTDDAGAPVPDVTVAVTESGMESAVRQVTTDSGGNYAIPYLKPGLYKLAVEQRGFQTFIAEGVLLVPGQARRLDARLPAGPPANADPVDLGAAQAPPETG